jgi:type IV secretion system protein VirB1
MTVADAFDPCENIAAGARVLAAAYRSPPAGQDAQPALLQAVSRYNTGHPMRGFVNGYVRQVQAAAEQIVPAIHVGRPTENGQGETHPPGPPPPPPAWDVYGQARYAREHAGLVLSGSQRAQVPAPASSTPQPPAQPVQLHAVSGVGDDR